MGFGVARVLVGRIELDSLGVAMTAAVGISSLAKEKEKKQRGKLFRRVKAEIKRRLVKKKRPKGKKGYVSFRYDPFSYALNFDSGDSGFFCL